MFLAPIMKEYVARAPRGAKKLTVVELITHTSYYVRQHFSDAMQRKDAMQKMLRTWIDEYLADPDAYQMVPWEQVKLIGARVFGVPVEE
jgi:hypothetical protein